MSAVSPETEIHHL